MKAPTLLLALGSLLSTAHAQTAPTTKAQATQAAPAKRQAARAHAVVAANGKAIGQKFLTKSRPTGSRSDRMPWMPIQ